MSANIQSDSTGKIQYVLTQSDNSTCALACCAMAYCEYNQFCVNDPEAAMKRVSQQFPGAWTKKNGTTLSNAALILTSFGVKNSGVVEHSGKDKLVQALASNVKFGRPAILAVGWGGGGGHAVLCVEVRGTGENALFVIRDPWFGLQEVPAKQMPAYTPGCSLTVNCSKNDKSTGTFSRVMIFTT